MSIPIFKEIQMSVIKAITADGSIYRNVWSWGASGQSIIALLIKKNVLNYKKKGNTVYTYAIKRNEDKKY